MLMSLNVDFKCNQSTHYLMIIKVPGPITRVIKKKQQKNPKQTN